jgi:hypothetical protein
LEAEEAFEHSCFMPEIEKWQAFRSMELRASFAKLLAAGMYLYFAYLERLENYCKDLQLEGSNIQISCFVRIKADILVKYFNTAAANNSEVKIRGTIDSFGYC